MNIGDLFDSPLKVLIIAIVVLVLFGGRKMPDAARSLGRSMRILKSEVSKLHDDDEQPEPGTQAQALSASPAPETSQLHQQQIDQLQQQIQDLQQQAGQAVTVNGSAAPETPRTQQPG